MKNTLCCLLQNRIGALERVLEALTYRGFMPEQFMSTLDPKTGCLHVVVTFECEEDKMVEKLIKLLNKQVYVLEIKRVTFGNQEVTPFASPNNIATLFAPSYVTTQRRMPHANNA